MEKGDLLYVRPKRMDRKNGVFGIFQEQYRGSEDLSYHGSPWYENFIVCTDPKTGETKRYGDQTYSWCDAKGYIISLQSKLDEIKKFTQWY